MISPVCPSTVSTTTTTPSPASLRRSRRTEPPTSPIPSPSTNVMPACTRSIDSDPLADLDHVAVLADDHVVARDAHLDGEPGVMLEMPALAVDRDEPPRPDQREHEPELLLGRVTAGVHRVGRHVVHVAAGPVQRVDDAMDRRLVARDQRRRQHDRVVRAELHPLVLPRRHQRQRRVRLTLAAGTDHDHPARDRAGRPPRSRRCPRRAPGAARAGAPPRRSSAWSGRGTRRPVRSPAPR